MKNKISPYIFLTFIFLTSAANALECKARYWADTSQPGQPVVRFKHEVSLTSKSTLGKDAVHLTDKQNSIEIDAYTRSGNDNPKTESLVMSIDVFPATRNQSRLASFDASVEKGVEATLDVSLDTERVFVPFKDEMGGESLERALTLQVVCTP